MKNISCLLTANPSAPGLLTGRRSKLTFGRTAAWVTREVSLYITQLNTRNDVHAGFTSTDVSPLPHAQAKSVFDPSTVGIFTQEIGTDVSELIFQEQHWFSLYWDGAQTRMWVIICLADKLVAWVNAAKGSVRAQSYCAENRKTERKRGTRPWWAPLSERSCDSGGRWIADAAPSHSASLSIKVDCNDLECRRF